MIGHVAMDIGLFAYWWTGIAGDFTARPITETGVDRPFVITGVVLAIALLLVLLAAWRLRRIGVSARLAVEPGLQPAAAGTPVSAARRMP